jgi:lipoprotein-anchoring transpeptidase ErfK/SrfK
VTVAARLSDPQRGPKMRPVSIWPVGDRLRGILTVRTGTATAALAALVLAAGCSGGAGVPSAAQRHSASASASAAAAQQVGLTISPASGRSVNPSKGILVTVSSGKITHVSVKDDGDPVTGTLNAAGTSWHSTWALNVSTRYTVTATAQASGGQPVIQSRSFTTLTPHSTFQTMIFEGQGASYGVGMPIMLTFSQPITDRAAVERALQIRTSKPVIGAWHWDTSRTVDFRPRNYWPAGTRISFTGHLNGVEGAPGMFGYHTLTQSFSIGQSLIVVASTASHHMSLYRGGKLIARWPISTGRPGDNTPNGTYLTIEKGNPVLMKGPGYAIEVPWSVRITFSGDYLHDAFWSVNEQGFTNVSHGCVNMPPAAAEKYYKMEVPGDPVTITGSPRGGTWDNGWTEWFMSWSQYVAGSALHQAVEAGPQGSTFVSPGALAPSTATAPLGTARANNARPS